MFFKIGFACAVLWGSVLGGYYLWSLTFRLEAIGDMPQRSAIYDMHGNYYSRLSGENRVVVPFDRVSNHFVNALITREDTRFYQHRGIDPVGIFRALLRNIFFGGVLQGGSTITQQLAKNSFPLGGRTLHRKLIEAALAFRIETELSKEQILEYYMNRIYFGSGYYGIEAASQAYFAKPASRLSLSESALLAGLIKSPNRLSPFNNLAAALRQRDVVLHRMHEIGMIDSHQLGQALAQEIVLNKRASSAPQENWAMDAIRRELDLCLSEEALEEGGLKIYTTLDPQLQEASQQAVEARLGAIEGRRGYPHPARSQYLNQNLEATTGTPYLQAAAISIDNRTGGIRALVGGRDYERSKYNRAILGKRQAGSVVKSFVFAKAFDQGLQAGEIISDDPIRPGELPARLGNYSPVNSDGMYRGPTALGEGLVFSRNTMAVRVGLRAGLREVSETLEHLGLAEEVAPFPSLCLGAFETTLKDLTAAYTAFPGRGVRWQPYLIDRIVDANGRTLFKATQGRVKVFSPSAATATTRLLAEVMTRGTAAKSRSLGLRRPSAGKTGTTNQYLDAWFVGFTEGVTCGVWVGFDQPKTIAPDAYGGELALPIWVDIIESPAAARYPHGSLF